MSAVSARTGVAHRPIVPKRDLPFWPRHGLKLWLLALGAVTGFLFVRTYAGTYYVGLETIPAVKHWFDSTFPVPWVRHLILRDEAEKSEALISVQVVVYYFASKWPRKAPGWWDRAEGWLGVANERLPRQGAHALVLAPLWALVYVLPGEGVGALVLRLTHQNAAEPKPWQVAVIGLLGSFFMGRRLAKGFAYRLQEVMIRNRLEQGKDGPAWWMHWPIQRRFEWEVEQGGITPRPTAHPGWRRARQAVLATVILLGGAALTYIGWWVMKFQQPFPYGNPLQGVSRFQVADLWQNIL